MKILFKHGFGTAEKIEAVTGFKLPSAPVICFRCNKVIDTSVETPGTITIERAGKHVQFTAPLCLDCGKELLELKKQKEEIEKESLKYAQKNFYPPHYSIEKERRAFEAGAEMVLKNLM